MVRIKIFSVILTSFVILTHLLDYGNGARILGVFPTASISHQVVFRGLTLALNKKGHELVVITTDPVKDTTLKNYREIDLSYLYPSIENLELIELRRRNSCWFDIFWGFTDIMHHLTRKILENPEVKKLCAIDSDEKFDVILIELNHWHAVMPFATRFNAPVIGMLSMGPTTHIHYAVGNPILSSHPSVWELGSRNSEPLTLWQRIENFISVWKYLYHYGNEYLTEQQKIAEEFFGNDIPPIQDIEKNVSLIFVNQQTPISFVRANVPKVIEIGGLHVSEKTQTLPKHLLTQDLKKTLDEATSGFLYMSLGSNVKSKALSIETRREILTAFSKLPYKVLWKFENDELPEKPDNVVIMKWTPQQAVLAHPNLKVFIYQGGLQSTEEAIHHAVPLIGLPTMADQDMNVNKMVTLGVAKKLEILAVRSEELMEAITTIAADKRYKERMLNLRSLVNNKPQDAMETTIWWTEHVIRHRGAPHLHSSTADEPWYRRYDMDLIAILSAGSVMILLAILFISYKFLIHSIRLFTVILTADEKKKRS